MTKEELLKEKGGLEAEIERLSSLDYKCRHTLSQFLGSYKRDVYSRSDEVKVLEWAEIYFKLGQELAVRSVLSDNQELRNRISAVEYQLAESKKEE